MLQKNEIIELTIDSLSPDGSGVGRSGGEVVFVPAAAPGDRLSVRIVKAQKNYSFGAVERVLAPSDVRIPADCPAFPRCGGCSLRHIGYAAELAAKRDFVRDALRRIGGLDVPVSETLAGPLADRYRNKVQFPVAQDAAGALTCGLYAARSHRVIAVGDCLLQPSLLNDIARRCCALLTGAGVRAYDERTRRGALRHLLLRQSAADGSVLVCLVMNAGGFSGEAAFCEALTREFPAVVSVVLNENRADTNVILGPRCRTLCGDGFLRDTLAGVPVRLSPPSFFQINHGAAEVLYAAVRRLAGLAPRDTLLDLYCGAGTIGLSLARDCKKLIGAEVVPEAVADARENARAMGCANCEFIEGDAGAAAAALLARGERIDVAVTDPPRKGCGDETLRSLVAMAPRRIVMVSCDPATLARDLKTLTAAGYACGEVQPVDLFPRTPHVETVVVMSKERM